MTACCVCILAHMLCFESALPLFLLLRRCGPRLSEEAADRLRNRYVMMRSGTRLHERETAKRTGIPITVRLGSLVWDICVMPVSCSCVHSSSTGWELESSTRGKISSFFPFSHPPFLQTCCIFTERRTL